MPLCTGVATVRENRPYIVLNTAMTADGKTDTTARLGARISSDRDLERVDRLRAACDAIVVGGRTLLGDDPKLTVKSAALRAERQSQGRPENPTKVGIISRIEDPSSGPTLQDESRFLAAGPARILVFTTKQTHPSQIRRVEQRGAEVFIMGEHRVDLAAASRKLWELDIKQALVEGGGTLNAALLRQGLVDEMYVYVAPLIFGGATAPTPVAGDGLAREEAIGLLLLEVEEMPEGGVLLRYALPRLS